jgi:hypothetical protein
MHPMRKFLLWGNHLALVCMLQFAQSALRDAMAFSFPVREQPILPTAWIERRSLYEFVALHKCLALHVLTPTTRHQLSIRYCM